MTGTVWPAARADPNALYYDLPLASNLFPALASISGRTPVAVEVTFTDAAGNSNTVSVGTFYFHITGPPLAVVEDSNFQAANDAKSTFPYRVNQANYATLYDGSTTMFNPENTVRLVHYIITNPAPQPVALTPSLPGAAWYDSETWTGSVTAMGHAYNALTPGRVQPPAGAPQTWCSWIQNNTGAALPADLTTATVGYSACAGTSTFTPPGGSEQCNTDPGAATLAGAQTSAGLETNAYYQSSGTDGAAASTTASGRYVVPEASNTSFPSARLS